MAQTNAERQAGWRARQKARTKDQTLETLEGTMGVQEASELMRKVSSLEADLRRSREISLQWRTKCDRYRTRCHNCQAHLDHLRRELVLYTPPRADRSFASEDRWAWMLARSEEHLTAVRIELQARADRHNRMWKRRQRRVQWEESAKGRRCQDARVALDAALHAVSSAAARLKEAREEATEPE